MADVRHLPGKHNQLDHGRRGGVRSLLNKAKTVDEVGAAASAEAKRITGRDIGFDMAGSDVQIAREHSEGILRGLEKYPHAELSEVRTRDFPYTHHSVMAHNRLTDGPIHHYPAYDRKTDVIEFNSAYAGNPTYYHNSLAISVQSGHFTKATGTPMGTALHEFGHTMGYHNNVHAEAGRIAVAGAAKKHMYTDEFVSKSLSGYATKNEHELTAEAFANSMISGSKAPLLARQITGAIDAAYARNNAHLPKGPL